MNLTRRRFAQLGIGTGLALSAGRVWAQGVSTHTAKSLPRPKASGRPFNAHFVDIAEAAGLHAPVIYGEAYRKKYILESTGCGCAFIDYDNDGWMDIFVLSGTRLEGAPPGTTNRLYKNNRDGTFTDVTEKAGLHFEGWACGVCIGDFNNDGFDDIFCTCYGQNILYRNNGDGTFTNVTKAAGLWTDQERWGAGCTFVDYDRNGHLDLFVSNYVRFSIDKAPVPGQNSSCSWKGIPVECGPRGLATGKHSLYRNNGDGTFTDVSEHAGINRATLSYGMTVVAADFDEDGWPDIYVACDSTPSLLFMNNHDGTFREEGVLRGAALSEDGMEQAGMGLGIGDYDLDGHLDILPTTLTFSTTMTAKPISKMPQPPRALPWKLVTSAGAPASLTSIMTETLICSWSPVTCTQRLSKRSRSIRTKRHGRCSEILGMAFLRNSLKKQAPELQPRTAAVAVPSATSITMATWTS